MNVKKSIHPLIQADFHGGERFLVRENQRPKNKNKKLYYINHGKCKTCSHK